jgi:HEAT repeat protein
MKTWRLHLVWFAVAVVGAAAWGQWTAARKERELLDRQAARPAAAAKANRPSAAPVAQASAAVTVGAPLPLPEPESPPAGAPKKDKGRPEETLTSEQIRSLLQSKNRDDVQRAVRAIEKLEDRAVKLALLKEALTVEDRKSRERALEILRKLGGPEAAELVAQALRTDREENVRERAARYLGDLGGPAALAALQQAAQSDSMDVRVASAGALSRLGQPGAVQSVLQSIGQMLDNPDGALRKDAVSYLDDLRTPATIPYLTRALRDSDSDVRRDAIEALEDLGLPELIPVLEQALADPNPVVVREAQQAIDRIRNPEPKTKTP